MQTTTQSVTGVRYIWEGDRIIDILRMDYNPNQPRDSRGRFASGGGGGGSSGGGKKGGGKGKPPVLQSGGGTTKTEDLSKLSLKELKERAPVGQKPEKNAHRKSSWIDLINKSKDSKKIESGTEPKKKAIAKIKEFTAPELTRYGKDYADQFLPKSSGSVVEDLPGYINLANALKAQSKINRKEAEKLGDKVAVSKQVGQGDAVRQMAVDFFELTGGGASGTLKTFTKDKDRGYADIRQGKINVGTILEKSVIFHEMGHFMEAKDPKVLQAAIEWREQKTGDSPLTRLNVLEPKNIYRNDEYAFPAKSDSPFIVPYVGKSYSFDGRQTATEVVSIGIEHFADPVLMRRLRKKDPSHFDFMVGLIANTNQGEQPTK